METFYPMVIAAVAVLATLVYASYLDIRDRRVPYKTWYPMLIVGIPTTALLLFQLSKNLGFTLCYITLVAMLLYDGYIDSETRSKKLNYLFLGIILFLPVLSWFIFSQSTILIIQSYILYASIILFVYYYDNLRIKRDREKKKTGSNQKTGATVQNTVVDMLRKYYFFIIAIIFVSVPFFFGGGNWGNYFYLIPLITIFCTTFYFFGLREFFGGADAWALIFITICIPFFPFEPIFGYNPIRFLPFTVLINSLLLNLVAPLGIFLMNAAKRNWAPFPIMFLGFPVKGKKIQDSWGFVMEVIEEENGIIKRSFFGFWKMLWKLMKGEGRGVYTKDLRENPEKYKKELLLFQKADNIWISYAVPFIVPITAGLVTAIIFGDFLFTIMKIFVSGV